MKLLFICTHNRCRSILAEAVTNFYGEGVLVAKSAGSQPVGAVHPLSIKYLQDAGIATDGLSSESWDIHENWNPDVVITVCDSAAGEPCPIWFGKSVKVHWGLVDPSAIDASEDEVADAFNKTIQLLKNRIMRLIEVGAHKESIDKVAEIFTKVEKI